MKLQTIIASTLLFIGLAHAATLPAENQCSYLGDCCEGGCDACCSGLECVGIVFPGVSATFLHVQLLCPYWLGHTGLHRISIRHRDVSKYWLASFRGIEVGLDLLREGLFLICPQISGLDFHMRFLQQPLQMYFSVLVLVVLRDHSAPSY